MPSRAMMCFARTTKMRQRETRRKRQIREGLPIAIVARCTNCVCGGGAAVWEKPFSIVGKKMKKRVNDPFFMMHRNEKRFLNTFNVIAIEREKKKTRSIHRLRCQLGLYMRRGFAQPKILHRAKTAIAPHTGRPGV